MEEARRELARVWGEMVDPTFLQMASNGYSGSAEIKALYNVDAIDRACRNYVQTSVKQAVEKSNPTGWEDAFGEFQQKNPRGDEDDFTHQYFDQVASELANLRLEFSKIEKITKNPTWWGDFLNFIARSDQYSSDFKTIKHRALLFQHMDLQNVYFYQEGRERLLLECECLNWAAEIAESMSARQEEDPLTFPLRKSFRFHPSSFVPSLLHLAEYRRQNQLVESWEMISLHLSKKWFGPLAILPALFSYSTDAQNFDKRHLLTTLHKWAFEEENPPPELALISLLGMSLTWSPSIHEFASVKDQKKIELFYLALKLDSGCNFFGLHIELFRKIFEDHWYLGNKHKTQCEQCSNTKSIHHLPLDVVEPPCCECECFVNFPGQNPKNFHFCFGADPLVDCWGKSWGVHQRLLEEKQKQEQYEAEMETEPNPCYDPTLSQGCQPFEPI